MKRLFKYMLLFISLFIFMYNLKAADGVTYSCDYSTSNGFKFRIRISNLPKEYLTSPQKIDNESKVKQYVAFYYYNGSSYSNANGNSVSKSNSGINKKVNYLKGALSDSVPSHTNQVQKFIINSTLDAKNIVCPTVYFYVNNNNGEMYISTESSRTYADDYGNTQSESNQSANLDSMNCYKDGSPYKCSKVEVGDLVEEGTKECTYTANGSNRFKLIYDKKNNTISFDKMGSALVLAADEHGTKVGDKYVLNNSELLSKFASSGDSCPKSIKCSCNSLGSGCSFYRDNTNSNCGKLVGEDGTDTDSKYNDNTNNNSSKSGSGPNIINPEFAEHQTCDELLGENLKNLIKAGIRIIQIAGAIIAIVNGMLALIPAVLAKDADGLQKASKKLVSMAIILAALFLFPTLIKIIGNIFSFDITCIL